MPTFVLVIDVIGLALAAIGFVMAFKSNAFRRMTRMSPPDAFGQGRGATDPLGYVLRIAGVMVMMFGIVLAGMFTLVYG